MASYRLIDELPDVRPKRAPFSPLGLFFLTWLYLPAAAPFWFLNWNRLGRPSQRWSALLVALGAFGLPFLLLKVTIDRETIRLVATLAKFAFAYFQLYGQRPLYEAHINRGGAKAPVWPLYAAAIAAIALQIARMSQ